MHSFGANLATENNVKITKKRVNYIAVNVQQIRRNSAQIAQCLIN
jgi:hypothetical protein